VLAFSLVAMLVMWSFNYVAGKVALRHLDPITLAAFRIELATLIILPIYFLRRNRIRLSARALWTLAWLGFFLVLNQFCFTVGLDYTSSGHSSVILSVGPIIVLLLAIAIKQEALTPGKLFGMAISFLGVILLEADRGLFTRSPFLTGDLLTLAGTSSFSIYAVFSKKFARGFDTVTMNTINLVAGAILLFPLAIRQGTRLDWGAVGWSGWAGLIYMAAISSVAAYLLFYWVLRYMTASRVAAINYFQPVGAILVSAAFLGEEPTRYLLAGGAIVLLGVFLAERGTT
jgi:drug/metabolite transporter (DMT)-like permease